MHTMNIDLAGLAELSRTRPVRLRVGRVIDGVSDRPMRDCDVVFDANEIRAVEPASGHADATLADHTLLPCLIEAHAHMFLDGAPVNLKEREQYLKQPPDWMLARARHRWTKILQCGIGAIRDAGDKHGVGLALAADAKRHLGKLSPTPYIDSPGAAIHRRGRYGSFMGGPVEDHATLQACVKARIAAGADRIKILASGIINFKAGKVTTPAQFSADEIRAMARVAMDDRNRQTFAHASGEDGVEACVEGGVHTIEHGFFITNDQLARMRDRGIAWVPTFAPVQLQIDRAADLGWDDAVVSNLKRIIDGHRDMLRKAHAMGVRIIAGSDAGSCGVPHGVGLLQELLQMEQAGLPPSAVIRSATGGAGFLLFREPGGTILPDHRSRFILTRHNPLETVANLQKDKTIFFDGRAIECPADLNTNGL